MDGRITYRALQAEGISPRLFCGFLRRQTVTKCRRKVAGVWRIVHDPFLDDWTEADHARLAEDLARCAAMGGLVLGAYYGERLVGFVSVEAPPMGPCGAYRDLSHLHVSQDMRRRGIGKALFYAACDWARAQGAEKLYLSAHSAVETQAFYAAMDCVEAAAYDPGHVEKEPCDCQMERAL